MAAHASRLALALLLAAPGLQAGSSAAMNQFVVEKVAIAKPMTIGLLGSAAGVSRIELRSAADGDLGKDPDGRGPVLDFRNTAYTLAREGTYLLRVYGTPQPFDLGFFWGFDKTNAKYGFRLIPAGGRLAVQSQSHGEALRDAQINGKGLLISVP